MQQVHFFLKGIFSTYLPTKQHLDDMSVQCDWTEFILQQTQAQYSAQRNTLFHTLLRTQLISQNIFLLEFHFYPTKHHVNL